MQIPTGGPERGRWGVNVLLGDGAVRFVTNGVSPATWQALATRAGGEVLGDF
jgi:hypothetical protein